MVGFFYTQTTTVTKLVIEYCIFSDCGTSNRGGAVFFSCTKGGIALNRVCGYNVNCQTTGLDTGGIFSFTSTEATQINVFDYVSVAKSYCNQFQTLCAHYGNQAFTSLNSSNNIVRQYSGFYSYHANVITQFSTIFSNSANDYISIGYRYNEGNNIFQQCNVVSNNSPKGYAVFYTGGSTTTEVSFCTFYNNLNTLFILVQGTSFSVSKCFIDHQDKLGSVSFSDNSGFVSTYPLEHYGSGICLGTNELIIAPTQQPSPTQSPFPTLIPTIEIIKNGGMFSIVFLHIFLP